MNQRWVVHQLAPGGDVFVISRAVDGLYVRNLTSLRNNSGIAERHSIQFLGNENGYLMRNQNGSSLNFASMGVDGVMTFTSAASSIFLFQGDLKGLGHSGLIFSRLPLQDLVEKQRVSRSQAY